MGTLSLFTVINGADSVIALLVQSLEVSCSACSVSGGISLQ